MGHWIFYGYIVYSMYICPIFCFCYKHSGFWMLELDFFSQNLATKWGVFFFVYPTLGKALRKNSCGEVLEEDAAGGDGSS